MEGGGADGIEEPLGVDEGLGVDNIQPCNPLHQIKSPFCLMCSSYIWIASIMKRKSDTPRGQLSRMRRLFPEVLEVTPAASSAFGVRLFCLRAEDGPTAQKFHFA